MERPSEVDAIVNPQARGYRPARPPEEIIPLASEEGYEFSDGELEATAGGGGWDCMSDCSKQGTCDHYGNYLNS